MGLFNPTLVPVAAFLKSYINISDKIGFKRYDGIGLLYSIDVLNTFINNISQVAIIRSINLYDNGKATGDVRALHDFAHGRQFLHNALHEFSLTNPDLDESTSLKAQ